MTQGVESSRQNTYTATPVPGARYYKSDLRPLPVIFMQQPRSWSSYAPGGVTLEYCPGPIPAERMAGLEEIDEAEAQRWLSTEMEQVIGPDGEVVLQERPEAEAAQPVVFRPRRWRQWFFGPPALLVLAYAALAAWRITAAASLPGARLQGELVGGFGLLVIVLFAVTFSLFKGRLSTYALTLSEASITAQAGLWRQRSSSILLDEVNTIRSARRTLVDRLLGRQYLYSRTGGRVVFVRRYFDRDVTRRLLGRVGVQAR